MYTVVPTGGGILRQSLLGPAAKGHLVFERAALDKRLPACISDIPGERRRL